MEHRAWPTFTDLAGAQASAATYFDYYHHERLHASLAHQLPWLAHQQLLSPTILNYPT
ncbi:hypothetical protein DDQ68_05305 [Hymenobacter nivis]|uniref:Integrase catalytic domain-containing protein n=1 Tax=Hymenobacter nivis TaxID=1850093 RepID=A0A2Z3GEX8_9BACT|nr:hypothetical protein DDQ68_05305 [Hymenobacter nivis]